MHKAVLLRLWSLMVHLVVGDETLPVCSKCVSDATSPPGSNLLALSLTSDFDLEGNLSFPIGFDRPLCTYFQCSWLFWKHKISGFSPGSTGRLNGLRTKWLCSPGNAQHGRPGSCQAVSDRLTTPLWGLCNPERKKDFSELCKKPEHLISYAISTLIITTKPKAYNQ